jgi:drug/metabolite transporter (DMT)-like permease
MRGSLFAVLSGFLYGFVGYFGLTIIHHQISLSTMTFWRFFIASFGMLIVLLPRAKHLQASRGQLGMAFINGALFYGLSTLLYFLACHYISSGLAMVLLFTFPVMVILINVIIYNQTIAPVYYLSALIIIIGMGFMVDPTELRMDLTGIGIMLISAFCYACYIIASKKCTLSPDLTTLMVSLGCMVTALIFALLDRSFSVPVDFTVWMHLLGIGLMSTIVPVLLMLLSLRHISSERASILSVLEPVFVVILGVLLLGEKLTLWHSLGILLVLGGAIYTLFKQPEKEPYSAEVSLV